MGHESLALPNGEGCWNGAGGRREGSLLEVALAPEAAVAHDALGGGSAQCRTSGQRFAVLGAKSPPFFAIENCCLNGHLSHMPLFFATDIFLHGSELELMLL